jgi:hypothetical protein
MMLSQSKELSAELLKEYNHLQLMWIRGKGYLAYNKKSIEATNLMLFGEDKENALKEFDLLVFKHLKEQYKGDK